MYHAVRVMFPMAPTRGIIAAGQFSRSASSISETSTRIQSLRAVRDMGHATKTISVAAAARRGGDRRDHAQWPEAGGFSDSQVELLQTFAEQAVIAISSAETYRELQARTAALARRNSEFGERIEQQSATIDVLKAMSASPDDTQPVFDLIVRRAQQSVRWLRRRDY